MSMEAPYGSWRSPVKVQHVAKAGKRLQQPHIDGTNIYWNESRPEEGGRYGVTEISAAGVHKDMLPVAYNIRNTVHEYGGQSYVVHHGTMWFSNFSDERIYRRDPDGSVHPVTAESPSPKAYRFAAHVPDLRRQRLISVREDHTAGGEPQNTLVAIDLTTPGHGRVLFQGTDFVASPCISPDGQRCAWITWDRPDMSFDTTTLWVADITAAGDLQVSDKISWQGVSILEPKWSPDNKLYAACDRGGWWNICRLDHGTLVNLCPMKAEFSAPQWELGISTFDFVDKDTILTAFAEAGLWRLGLLHLATGTLETIDCGLTLISDLHAGPGFGCFFGASPTQGLSLFRFTIATRKLETLYKASTFELDPRYISKPRSIEVPTADGAVTHMFFYEPVNPDCSAPQNTRPPLLVMSHGGPNHANTATLDPKIQFWTTRGFAVADVNYRGSTAYGRAYRESLKGNWGVTEVFDHVAAGEYLAARQMIDPEKTIIFGSSAGGYNVLSVLVRSDFFKVGVDVFGLSDLAAFVEHTHKFESQYFEYLVGPYPEAKKVYDERSPIYHADKIKAALLVLQGADDRIVLPSQAQIIVDELIRIGKPVAYLLFDGEQHGFRKEATLVQVFQSQQSMFAQILGITPGDDVPLLTIENHTRVTSDA